MTERIHKLITHAASLALGIIIGVGGCMTANAIKNQNQISHIDTEQEQVTGNELIITEAESHGIKLATTRLTAADYNEMGISPQAVSSTDPIEYKITATLYPASAICELEWTIEFVNPNSTWAKGKSLSQYCLYSDVPKDPLSILFLCKQAFGEPVEVKATTKKDPSIFATCKVDYAKRVNCAQLTFESIGFTVCEDEYGGGDFSDVVMVPLYPYDTTTPNWKDIAPSVVTNVYYQSTGTVNPEIISTKTEIKVSDKFLEKYNAGADYKCPCRFENWDEGGTNDSGMNRLSFASFIEDLTLSFVGGYNLTSAGYTKLLEALSTYSTVDFYIRITATVKYGAMQINEVTEYKCMFARNSQVFNVGRVELPENIVI